MLLSFEQAVQLIELLIILIAMILIHRSIPAAQMKALFDALEKAAKTTATPVDDQAVSAGRLLATLLTGQVSQPSMITNTPAPDPTLRWSYQQQGMLLNLVRALVNL